MTIKTGVVLEIPNDIPTASGITIGQCTACEHLHIILHDEDGRPFAQAVLSSDMTDEIAAAFVTRQ
jgi:hypothetical protein